MRADNLFKGYGRQGVNLDLAELVEPADLKPLRKIEKTFAQALEAHEAVIWRRSHLEPPKMKVRIGNLKRTSNYLDCYLTELEKATQPRGIAITFPNGDGYGARWHGKVWKSEKRIPFEYALADARKAVKDPHEESPETQQAILDIGLKWQAAIADLVAMLTERAAERIAA